MVELQSISRPNTLAEERRIDGAQHIDLQLRKPKKTPKP
jgi:hypothetical protein